MSEPEGEPSDRSTGGLPTWLSAILPIVLLVLLLVAFVVWNPLGTVSVQAGEPLPDVSITQVTIPNTEIMVVHVVNNGPDPITISQVLVDEAYWEFRMAGAGGDRTLEPMGSARLILPYHVTPGFDYDIALVASNGATFHHTVVAASKTPGATSAVLWTLALIGVFVGVIPVAIGMLWFPAMQRMADRTLHAVLAFSAGILAFLVFDAGFEAFEFAAEVPGAYEGPILVVLGIVGSLLLVQAAMDRAGGDHPSSLVIAYGVALGIGLHNLAEGLAIGSSFALGRVSLGAFLVIGFMVHNVTEGPAIVAPLARGDRPAVAHFIGMGALAGVPTIAGGWLGNLAFSPTLGALFLAIGVGALLQVIFDIAGIVRRAGTLTAASNLLGFLIGFVVMYATDLYVAL